MTKEYKIGSKTYKVGSFAQAVKPTTAKKAVAKKPEPKFTIGGARPKVKNTNTTGATNRTSGYLNPFAKGNTPKGSVSEKITTKSGKTVILTQKLKPGASSGYLNPNAAGNKKSTVKKVANVKRKRSM